MHNEIHSHSQCPRLAHLRPLLFEELLDLGLHAGGVEVHDKEERHRASTR